MNEEKEKTTSRKNEFTLKNFLGILRDKPNDEKKSKDEKEKNDENLKI